jgi:hypothetical protein
MKHLKSFISSLLIVFAFCVHSFPQKMNAEEVLSKHLESIGTSEKRASVKSQIAVGNGAVKFISQKNLSAQGRIVIASSLEKLFVGMNFNALDYPIEKFSFDGNKSNISFTQNGARSILGKFLQSNKEIIENGLLGGTLSTSWVLSNLTNKKAKLSYDGTKKIDGKEVYAIGYTPKGGGDIDIILYFDKDTFRHIRTEYKRIASASAGRTADQSARQSETRFKISEDFSEFKDEKGLMLPHKYRLLYSVSGQNGTTEIEWLFDINEFAFNSNIDSKTFSAEAN